MREQTARFLRRLCIRLILGTLLLVNVVMLTFNCWSPGDDRQGFLHQWNQSSDLDPENLSTMYRRQGLPDPRLYAPEPVPKPFWSSSDVKLRRFPGAWISWQGSRRTSARLPLVSDNQPEYLRPVCYGDFSRRKTRMIFS